MESCYEYLGCGSKDCIMYGQKDKECWKVEGTLYNNHGIHIVREHIAGTKENACVRSGCISYKNKVIRHPKNYRCAKIITKDQFLH